MAKPRRDWRGLVLSSVKRELTLRENKARAIGAYKYMKKVAPFLGVSAPDRKLALRKIFAELPDPTSDEIGETAIALAGLKYREFHYAAYDLIDYFIEYCDQSFLNKYAETLLTTTPWWDTVDGLVNAMVCPLTKRFKSRKIIDRWNRSENIWLIRASIGHQRGRKFETEVPYVTKLCQRHVHSHEFFIAKAIGWALRDISRFDKSSVREFLNRNPNLDRVAKREALRYL